MMTFKEYIKDKSPRKTFKELGAFSGGTLEELEEFLNDMKRKAPLNSEIRVYCDYEEYLVVEAYETEDTGDFLDRMLDEWKYEGERLKNLKEAAERKRKEKEKLYEDFRRQTRMLR